MAVTFKALTEDSRCPEGAVCVWKGNAGVVVSLSETDVSLNTTLQPREVSQTPGIESGWLLFTRIQSSTNNTDRKITVSSFLLVFKKNEIA